MADIRPAASLTSSLLARRGDARPAMRRQAIAQLHVPLTPQDDLGWNDTGEASAPPPPMTSLAAIAPAAPAPEPQMREPAPVAAPPAITQQLEAIAQRLNEKQAELKPAEPEFKPMLARRGAKRATKAEAAAASRKAAAFTLRIDPERHLRLRLLSALANRSSQQLLIEALDTLLAGHGKIEDLAGQVENGTDADE